MNSQLRPLTVTAVRERLKKLNNDDFSKVDFERLDEILPLFDDDESPVASVADCLDRLNAGSDVRRRLADFRALRHRLKTATAKVGMGLELSVDSKKRSKPEDRLCWFTLPPDPAADYVADWTDQVTDSIDEVTGIYSSAALSGGLAVRFVVAYDEQDRHLAEDLLSRLKEHVDAAEPYDYSIWEPEKVCGGKTPLRELLHVLEESADFGLVMSPQWATADSPDLDALRSREERNAKPIIRVSLKDPDRATESFESRDGEREKIRFALELAHKIRDRLQKHQSRMEQERGAQRLADAVDAPSDYVVESKAQETSLDAAMSLPLHGRQLPAIDALTEWVKDEDAPPYFALFGEYGIGKTTTLKQFAQQLLKQRREGKEAPLPIFMDLRNYIDAIHKGTIPPIKDLLQELLDGVWKIPGEIMFTAQDILRLVQEEGAVLIFDGLDEKLVHLDERQGQALLRRLWEARPPSNTRRGNEVQVAAPDRRGRLIFSCRSHYFKTLSAQGAMLRGEDRDGVRGTHYRAWHLLPFDEAQIRKYLEQVLGADRVDATLEKFESVHNLLELTPRPYLLSLIAKPEFIDDLERWRSGDTVAGALTPYEFLVDQWLRRDDGKHRLRSEDKLRLMEDIAADMWRQGAREWPWHQVLDWFSRRLGEKAEWRTRYVLTGLQEVLEEDFRTATFVLRPDDSQDRFRFAHTSLQEYFLAGYLHRALVEGEQQNWEMDVPSPRNPRLLGPVDRG